MSLRAWSMPSVVCFAPAPSRTMEKICKTYSQKTSMIWLCATKKTSSNSKSKRTRRLPSSPSRRMLSVKRRVNSPRKKPLMQPQAASTLARLRRQAESSMRPTNKLLRKRANSKAHSTNLAKERMRVKDLPVYPLSSPCKCVTPSLVHFPS